MTFTGTIGTICMFPLRAIIRISVALGISPNTLTLIGVLINCTAALGLAINQFVLSGLIMICANIFDFIDGKVALHHGEAVGVRRVLGLDARSLFGSRALHRPHLALRQAGPQRLRAHHDADADLLRS